MKKKVLLLAVLAMFASVAVSGTLAYFTAEEKAHNVITSGNVSIELVEKTNETDGTQIDFPKEGISNVMPGTYVSKIVSVENTGETEAWIRVWVDVAIEKASDSNADSVMALPLEIEKADGSFVDAITWQVDTDKWIFKEENGMYCYYYKTPVEGKKSTETLFETVNFAPEMGNEYQNCKVLIDISAEAVQSANNPIPPGGNVTNVKGWPEV